MNQEEIDKSEPQFSKFLIYPKDHGESLYLNIVNPVTASEYDIQFESKIMEYLKGSTSECCVSEDFKAQLVAFNVIDHTNEFLYRCKELIEFLLNYKSTDCDESILTQHKAFIEELVEGFIEGSSSKPFPNIDPSLFQTTDEERRAAWKIHTTIVISKIIFSACAEYRAEYEKWKEAQVDQTKWDLYTLGY